MVLPAARALVPPFIKPETCSSCCSSSGWGEAKVAGPAMSLGSCLSGSISSRLVFLLPKHAWQDPVRANATLGIKFGKARRLWGYLGVLLVLASWPAVLCELPLVPAASPVPLETISILLLLSPQPAIFFQWCGAARVPAVMAKPRLAASLMKIRYCGLRIKVLCRTDKV